jgi:hypothetical protein
MPLITNKKLNLVTHTRCVYMSHKHSIQLNRAKTLRLSLQLISFNNHISDPCESPVKQSTNLSESISSTNPFESLSSIDPCESVSSIDPLMEEKIISIGSIDNDFESIINRSINDTAITKWFNRNTLEYNHPINPSRATYRGMCKNLITLTKQLINQNIDPIDYCVLCPHYTLRPDELPHKECAADDTQAGGGGKATRFLNKETLTYHCESFDSAVRGELEEELRITGNLPKLMSRILSVRYNNHQNGDEMKRNIETNVYAFNVNECKVVDNFDATHYNDKKRRGENDPSRIVGYIVWGKREDCINLVSQIKTNCPINVDRISMRSNLVDTIDAISIISLPKAISMARYATEYFTGLVTDATYM